MENKKEPKSCFGNPVQESDRCNKCELLNECVDKLWNESGKKQNVRTVQEFVEDLLSNGRTAKQILAVAENTRWESKIEEVKEVIKSFSKKFKKRFQIIDENGDNIVNKD